MVGRIVTQTNLDTVRIERIGVGSALSIPAELVLAIDCVMRYCVRSEGFLELDMVQDDKTGWEGWEARTESQSSNNADFVLVAHGDTPWAAIKALANAIEAGK